MPQPAATGETDLSRAIAAIPLFAGLPLGEIERLLRICEPRTFADGDVLVRQGQPADGAYILETGSTDILTALPGGGDAVVARLGAGSVLGEMALLERGVRSATAIARGPVGCRFIGRDSFRLLLAQREHAAFAIRGRITRTLCQRLRELNTRIVAYDANGGSVPERDAPRATASGLRFGAASFEWRRFLPHLPAFEALGPDSIAEFAVRTQCLEIARGDTLFAPGDPCTAAFVVVRGALQIDSPIAQRWLRIGILGPGRLCGILALIEGRTHLMRALARERTTLLAIAQSEFDALFNGTDLLAIKVQDAVNRELLGAIARTNNHLTRLVSQAHIRGLDGRGASAAGLQRELALIDCDDTPARGR